jgi:hypothetical protein
MTRDVTSVASTRTTSYRPAPTLDAAGQGQRNIERGMSGQSVRELQQQLRDRGHQIQVDGLFGPRTEEAVRAFQRANGARVDGIVGPETTGKLRVPPAGGATDPGDGLDRGAGRRDGPPAAPTEDERRVRPGSTTVGDLARNDDTRMRGPSGVRPTLAPPNATERERFDHYAAIIRANGGQVNPNGQPSVLAIRGMSRDGNQHDTTSNRRYDDTFVVLTPDGRARELRGATHPGQTRSSLSPDVNGDGVGDVGMIRPGNYTVVPNGPHRGAASFHVRTENGSGNIPGWRDTNHDGAFSDAERRASERRGDTLTEILFHQGGDSSPISIGCLTMPPAEYQRFLNAIGGGRARFNFSLVDANGR